jgi:hypothetical protein
LNPYGYLKWIIEQAPLHKSEDGFKTFYLEAAIEKKSTGFSFMACRIDGYH